MSSLKRDGIMNREKRPQRSISRQLEGAAGGVASLFGAPTVVTVEYNEEFFLLPSELLNLLNAPLTALGCPIDLEPAVVNDPDWQKFLYYRIPFSEGDVALLYLPNKLLADGRVARDISWMGHSWADSEMGGNAKAMYFFSDSDSVADAFEKVKGWFTSIEKIQKVDFFCEDFRSRLESLDGDTLTRFVKSKLNLDDSFSPAKPSTAGESVEIFVSYAHEDEKLFEELKKQLENLRRQKLIDTWHDRKIVPSQNWSNEIDDHINSAKIILLLISPDFMASDYCYEVEMTRAIERHESDEDKAHVVPIILRPVDWQGAPFSSIQALPKNALPITSWEDQDSAFLNVVQGIRKLLGEI